ncbi:MAG TPA: hypothetical protein EYG03_18365 [Planctomycetes bacterium]|nr:hypothetical protein [Fuerstiella sp.]HIK93915.1 hypothetical protein [Planctomycetota bacterium]
MLSHVEESSSCQEKLQSLAADESWWHRASCGLSHVTTDTDGLLPTLTVAANFVETLLDANGARQFSGGDSVSAGELWESPLLTVMPARIDDFDIERRIGQGGMGIVFRGFDRTLKRPVAIKVMSPHLGANGTARQRFAREAQAAAAVVHPHVVPIYRVSDNAACP